MAIFGKLVTIFILLYSTMSVKAYVQQSFQFGPFDKTYTDIMAFTEYSNIYLGSLQITPDTATAGPDIQNKSGRVLFATPFKFWDGNINTGKVISFNTSFLINILRVNKSTPAEGFSFIIAPDLNIPLNSHGKYLGLTNSSTDGNPENHFIAIELDTYKQDFDQDDNHMGLNLNSIKSTKTASLHDHGIEISPIVEQKHMVWVQYNGGNKILSIYMDIEGAQMPKDSIMNESINIQSYLKQYSYFGFAASTGNFLELNCLLRWNLTVEILPNKNDKTTLKIGLSVGGAGLVLLIIFAICVYKRRPTEDQNILGAALQSLPGMPREFRFRELRDATNNFDEKLKLGQGGFGVVYKGVLAKEDNVEIAVKKFSRESIKGRSDFLAELTIINRLRHKHLVRLVGWCHKNGMLLLVYDYMPNGSLDQHLFSDQNEILSWDRRYTIITCVASALQYLHSEYDQKVVHRDLKASNIMLDCKYNARLGDFGLARALENERTSYAEVEGIPGTMGYIAPESFHTGKATLESDVYSFGAVVLEVVCGRRPWEKIEGFHSVVDWVWTLYRDGHILEAVDIRLESDYMVEQAERLMLLGLACSHPIASKRPKSEALVQMVSGFVSVPIIPQYKPHFVWPVLDSTAQSSITLSQDATISPTSYYSDSGWNASQGGEELSSGR